MKQDRFLTIILVVIALIVALALATFFLRQSAQAYVEETSPEGALRNYILALQKSDYQRAYSYLVDGEGKPEYTRFRQSFMNRELDVTSAAVQIGVAEMDGSDAIIKVTMLRGQTGLFSSVFRDSQTAMLTSVGGAWKISAFTYPYWGWDWYTQNVEKPVPATP